MSTSEGKKALRQEGTEVSQPVLDRMGNELKVGDPVVILHDGERFAFNDDAGKVAAVYRFRDGEEGVEVDVRNEELLGWFDRELLAAVRTP